MTSPGRTIEVCAAVIVENGRFLLARRPPGKHLAGMWEFPGGKIDPGENREQCIVREIREELDLPVAAGTLITTIEHQYPDRRVRLHFLTCHLNGHTGRPEEPDSGQPGAAVGWFPPRLIPQLALAPADRRFWQWLQRHDGRYASSC